MQVTDELVKKITQELMKRLGNGSALAAAAPKPLLHLAGSRGDISTAALAAISEAFEIYEHQKWDDHIPPNASVLLTRLGLQALTRVAEGDEGCTVEGRALMEAVLSGRPVAALEEGLIWRKYMATAPKPLLARYAQHERVLQSYGLKIVREHEVVEALLGRPAAARTFGGASFTVVDSKSAPAVRGRRVINEGVLMALCPEAKGEGQTLTLSAGDILTPLARDYALAMKINIVKA